MVVQHHSVLGEEWIAFGSEFQYAGSRETDGSRRMCGCVQALRALKFGMVQSGCV